VASNEIVRLAWQELGPRLNEQGYDLVEVEFAQQGRRRILRVFIDQLGEGAVTLNDCQAASRLLSPVLDALDPVKGSYTLEVSSPGIDRPLRKPADFERFSGERVRITAHTPVNGRRRFRGALHGVVDGMIRVDCEGNIYEIHLENVKKANLDR